MILFISLTLLALSNFYGVETGDHFTINGRLYYSSYPDNTTWYRAMRFCSFNGMYMIDVPTEIENQRILNIIKSTKDTYGLADTDVKFWTGASKEGLKTKYFWISTAQPVIWTNWADKQPDNMKDKYCVLYLGSHELKWANWWCEINAYFICRDKPSTTLNFRARQHKHSRRFGHV